MTDSRSEPAQKRVMPSSVKRQRRSVLQKAGSASAAAAPPSSPRESPAGVVTVEDTDALDCGVCFLPLKPPIFQCDVGHVVCSPCRDKLKTTGKCHVCGVATGDYRRCHAMERLVESIRIPCPHAAYGCATRLAYFDQHCHPQTCVHAPCHCPDEACSFIGSTAALAGHYSSVHGWPSSTEVRAGYDFTVLLRDGFNFVLANHATDAGQGASAGSSQYLLLLNVVRQQPLGRAISVVCIHPHGASGGNVGQQGPSSCEIQCRLTYSHFHYDYKRRGDQLISYYQFAGIRVPRTDLSNGLPSPDGCFPFAVPLGYCH